MRIIVLGGGPGGYTAAFEAARLGAEVVLIEADNLGGTCLNWGCIPTKTILRSAHIVADTKHAAGFGLVAAPATVDIDTLRARKEAVVEELRGQIATGAKRLKVEVVMGRGRMVAPKIIEVALAEGGTATYEGDAVILATGSSVFKLPSIDHDLPGVWTSDEATSLSEIPKSIVIIGGGIIGLEFACAYAAFGAKVDVVELTPAVMPGNDKRVQRTMADALSAQGVTFHLGVSADSVEQIGDGMRVTLANGTVIEAEKVLSAVGRIPNSAGLGFPEAGIEMDRAAVKVDEFFRTNIPGVYAIGDLIGGMMLAHVAEVEGHAAAGNAVAEFKAADGSGPAEPHLHRIDYRTVPAALYTFPGAGVVGTTRDSAKEKGIDAIAAVAKFAGNGKALAEGEADGFVQIVAEKGTGAILGCQIVGPHAAEIIQNVAIAMAADVTVAELGGMTFGHPTVSEVIKAAALDAASKV